MLHWKKGGDTMDFFKKPIMRVPSWTFLCGFVTTILQMLVLPQVFGRAYADHIDLFARLFNGLAVVLFFVIGFFVMHKLPRKTLFASAAVNVAISLVIILLEQITGAAPLLVFLFFLYPFLYFSSSLSSILLGLFPTTAMTPVVLLCTLVSFLFVLFGRSGAAKTEDDEENAGS